jgi:hypothetical protein
MQTHELETERNVLVKHEITKMSSLYSTVDQTASHLCVFPVARRMLLALLLETNLSAMLLSDASTGREILSH